MNSNKSMQSLLSPYRRPYPSKLFIETTTRCNLGCFMCPKQADGCEITEGDLTAAIFTALKPALPHLEALILNGIGEPLLNPHLEEFIRKARGLMPRKGWIGFQSNGLLITNLRAISLIEAGVDRICLSVDAASPEMFRKVRDGGDIPDVEHAMAALMAAKEQCSRPEVRVGIEFVAMRSNLGELVAALRWAAKQGASFAIVTHLLPYDEQHWQERAYEICTEEAVALFTTYKEQAERQGLDLNRYFQARWKYQKSDEEQRLVELVDAMKLEGENSGLFMDLKKLIRIDGENLREVTAVFAEAEAVARELGLDLQLPAVSLTEKRHCGFVEEGGAFVSWEGNVHPCYFLWHRYRCFASGWDQQVQPKVFGNVLDQDILEIWNNADFSSFREQVTGYDYPNCSSCTLAPCDYVQTEQFEQDCHIKGVPCSACLWNMGVFHCLS